MDLNPLKYVIVTGLTIMTLFIFIVLTHDMKDEFDKRDLDDSVPLIEIMEGKQ